MKNNFSVLGEGPTDFINDNTSAAEKKVLEIKKLTLYRKEKSLHYNVMIITFK